MKMSVWGGSGRGVFGSGSGFEGSLAQDGIVKREGRLSNSYCLRAELGSKEVDFNQKTKERLRDYVE